MEKCQETQLKDGKLILLQKAQKFTSKQVTTRIKLFSMLPGTGSGFPDSQVSHGDSKEHQHGLRISLGSFSGFVCQFVCVPCPGLGLGRGEWSGQGTVFKKALTGFCKCRISAWVCECLLKFSTKGSYLTQVQCLLPASPNCSGFPVCHPPPTTPATRFIFLSDSFSSRWNWGRFPRQLWILRAEPGFRFSGSPFAEAN